MFFVLKGWLNASLFLFFKPAVATEAKIELLRWTLFSPFLSVTYNRFPLLYFLPRRAFFAQTRYRPSLTGEATAPPSYKFFTRLTDNKNTKKQIQQVLPSKLAYAVL